MNHLNLKKDRKYLLACSFGPDSMALFHLLRIDGYNFECAIVNYHLREESNSEVEGLVKYASNFGIKVHILYVKKKISKNIESECRKIRYDFFKELSDKYQYDATLVAHHQDDVIETFLLQKQRQNCPIYFGIKEKTVINNVTIIRPILAYTKAQLISICNNNNVPYSVDKTNFDVSIKRNKIRHEIVSKMSQSERNQIIDEIGEENSKLNKLFSSLKNTDLNSVEQYLKLNDLEKEYALHLLLEKEGLYIPLSTSVVGQITNVLKSSKSNGEFKIKKDLYVYKEYGRFSLNNKKTDTVSYKYVLNEPRKLETEYFKLDFTKGAENRNIHLEDYPLTIRNIDLNDSIVINGYKVKANRLLIDWKVPYRIRLIWPVILNNKNEVIYIPRYQQKFKVTEDLNFYVKVSCIYIYKKNI